MYKMIDFMASDMYTKYMSTVTQVVRTVIFVHSGKLLVSV